MCQASKALKDLEFAREGDDVVIATNGFGGQLFARPGDCGEYVCLPFSATVVFQSLPAKLQRRLGIGREVEVVMVMVSPDLTQELHNDDRDDEFMLATDSSKRFLLSELPRGTTCRVTHVPAVAFNDMPAAIEQIDREVTAVMSRHQQAAERPLISA